MMSHLKANDQRTLSVTDVPVRRASTAWRELAGEMVVLDTSKNVVRGLNAIGGMVWRLIDGSRTTAAIAREIAVERGAPEERVLADVLAFLERLLVVGVIDVAQVTGGASPS